MKEGIALLKAAQKLDEEALTAIFDQFAPAIYKYTLRLCHDPIVADKIWGGQRSAYESSVLPLSDCLSPGCGSLARQPA
jgi:hypothetical protein